MPDRRDADTAASHSERMAELGGDRSRLLRGEDPQTGYPDDARHWIAVYRELLDFKQDMLRTIDEHVPQISDSAREEVLGTDVPVMQAEAARFVDRLSFWEGRLQELEKGRGGSRHG